MKTLEQISNEIQVIDNLIIKSNLMQDEILSLQFYMSFLKSHVYHIQEESEHGSCHAYFIE